MSVAENKGRGVLRRLDRHSEELKVPCRPNGLAAYTPGPFERSVIKNVVWLRGVMDRSGTVSLHPLPTHRLHILVKPLSVR